MNKAVRLYLFFIFTLIGDESFSHGKKKHSNKTIKKIQVPNDDTSRVKDKEINKSYLAKVKPIFKRSCFDCHSGQTKYPWYYKLPIVGKVIDKDIADAKKHLDFSKDYPFVSHESPTKDLKSIKKSLLEGRMPPLNYRFLHWDASLSEKDKKNVVEWVNLSLKELSGL